MRQRPFIGEQGKARRCEHRAISLPQGSGITQDRPAGDEAPGGVHTAPASAVVPPFDTNAAVAAPRRPPSTARSGRSGGPREENRAERSQRDEVEELELIRPHEELLDHHGRCDAAQTDQEVAGERVAPCSTAQALEEPDADQKRRRHQDEKGSGVRGTGEGGDVSRQRGVGYGVAQRDVECEELLELASMVQPRQERPRNESRNRKGSCQRSASCPHPHGRAIERVEGQDDCDSRGC